MTHSTAPGTPVLHTTTDPTDTTTDMDEQDARRRRLAAWRASKRVLWRSSAEYPVGECLAGLTADAATVYDLDEPVDLYGDGVVGELERRTAALLGLPAAVYFPTGTMAQQVALRCWAGRTGNSTVALHPQAHPEVHERSAFAALSGLRTIHRPPNRGCRRPTRCASATSRSAR